MSQEIERKFLVQNNNYKAESCATFKINQGYLSSDPERSVRVRIKGNFGYITVKGAANASGISRFEWEKEIDILDAEELLKICEPGIIDKIRYVVKYGNHIYEVDEFSGENMGLIVAEVELLHEDDVITKPDWLGAEVTGDPKYYNSALARKPFNCW